MNAAASQEPRAAEKAALIERYDRQIDWYWRNSGQQKFRFIRSRFAILVLGATVTLIASLAAASFVEDSAFWDNVFKIATPVLAAVLAVLTGLSQTFQWGAAWREFNLSAMALEKERDRILLTPPYRLDPLEEIARFNDLVIDETRRYFERVTGATRVAEIEQRVTEETRAGVAAVSAARVNLTPAVAPAVESATYAEPETYVEETYVEETVATEPYVEEYTEETVVYEEEVVEPGGDEAAVTDDYSEEEVSGGDEAAVTDEYVEEGDGGPPGGYPAEEDHVEGEGDEV